MDAKREMYDYRGSWLQLIRPLTLTGTISPILAGTALASTQAPVHIDRWFAMLLAALLVQASVNMLNDYFDFRNGQDQEKWQIHNPTASHHGPAHRMLPVVAGLMLVGAVPIGFWLAVHSSVWVAVVGAVSIGAGYKYSAGSPALCAIGLGELIAAIFLGTVVTTLAYVVQGHAVDLSIIAVSLPFSFLIASMILTNNIRDMDKDRPFRKTLPIILGRKHAVMLLFFIISLAYLSVILLGYLRIVSWPVCALIMAWPFAARLCWSVRQNAARMEAITVMKWAGWHHWIFGLVLAWSIWLSA